MCHRAMPDPYPVSRNTVATNPLMCKMRRISNDKIAKWELMPDDNISRMGFFSFNHRLGCTLWKFLSYSLFRYVLSDAKASFKGGLNNNSLSEVVPRVECVFTSWALMCIIDYSSLLVNILFLPQIFCPILSLLIQGLESCNSIEFLSSWSEVY